MIFFSTFMYALAKQEGPGFRAAVARELELGPRSRYPAFHVLAALAATEDVVTAVSGPCLIAPGRSMMAGQFLASKADVWVTCDDDTGTIDGRALELLVRACRDTRAIVSVPSLQRDIRHATFSREHPGYINVRLLEDDRPEISTGDGYSVARIRRTGMGLVALHRDAVDHMRSAHPELEVRDDETGVEFPGLFYEILRDRRWLGEDNSFCERARALGIELFALLDVETTHAGRRMVLELDGEGQLAMRVFDVAG